MSRPQLWTPEYLGWGKGQAHMSHQDDSTEDDMLYVEYDDYKAVSKVRDEWCAEYTKVRDLLLACRHGMKVSMDFGGRTEWKTMIDTIDKATGFVGGSVPDESKGVE